MPPMVAPGTVSSRASRWPALGDAPPGRRRAGAPACGRRRSGRPRRGRATRSSRRGRASTSALRGGQPPGELGAAPAGHDGEAVRRARRAAPRPPGRRRRAGPRGRRDAVDVRRPAPASRTSRRPRPGPRARSVSSSVGRTLIRRPPRVRPAASGCAALRRPGTSPHSRGVGKTLPGFEMFVGSKAQRTSCMVSRSVVGVHPRHVRRLVRSPTPCSPVIDPPCSMQRSRIAPLTFSAASPAPSTASSKSTSGCRLPSPAWKTLATRTPEDGRRARRSP